MSSQIVVSVGHRQQPLRQRPSAYGVKDHSVWTALYCRRFATLLTDAAIPVLSGIEYLDLGPSRIPNFRHLNRRLVPRTGWAVVPGESYRPEAHLARSLSRRRLPSAVAIRPSAEVEHPPASDIFADLVGRVPLLAEVRYAGFLERFGAVSLAAKSPEAREGLAGLFAFTATFGLIREGDRTKVYGSELVPSVALSRHALGTACVHRPFSLAEVLATPVPVDRLPEVLFVLDDFAQLRDAVDSLASLG